MRFINKLITLILLLVLAALIPALLIVPDLIFTNVLFGIEQLRDLLAANIQAQPAIIYGGAAGIELLLLILIILQFRRSNQDQGRVKLVGGGTVEVAYQPIASRLEKVAKGVGGVKDVSAEVSTARRRLKVSYDVVLRPGATARTVQSRIEEATRETVEGNLGVKLAGKPDVNMLLKQATGDSSSSSSQQNPASNEGGGLFGLGKKQSEPDDSDDIGDVPPPPPVVPPGGFSFPSSSEDDE